MADTRTTFYHSHYDVHRSYVRAAMPGTLPVTSISTATLTLTTAANATAFVPGEMVELASTEKPSGELFQIQAVAAGTLELATTPTGHTTSITVRKLSRWMSYHTSSAVSPYSVATTPSAEEITRFLEDSESRLEEDTGHAWRAKTVTEEIHDWPSGPAITRTWLDGVKLPLGHRQIRAFSTTTDNISVHNGGTGYTNMTTPGTWTEGHVGGQFWFDYERGDLFIKHFFRRYSAAAISITYRYGAAAVPNDVRRAATLLSLIALTEADAGNYIVPEGQGDTGIAPADRIGKWEGEYKRIVARLKEQRVIAP